MLKIGPDSKVTLNFALRVNVDEEVDSTFGKEPATFVVGEGSLLPGFEQALFGMKAGDKEVIRIAPEQGFGVPNQDNIKIIALDAFSNIELSRGLVVMFNDPTSGTMPGLIHDYSADGVTVDFNHPLAGKEIWFEVEILKVEAASGEPTSEVSEPSQ